LTKQVLETALEVELTEHLGHERMSVPEAATFATATHARRSAPTSAMCGSLSHVIGLAASHRWWCRSIRAGWAASTTRS
jgi:hypothetical protein